MELAPDPETRPLHSISIAGVLRRPEIVTGVALAVTVIVAWSYLIAGPMVAPMPAGDMPGMPGMSMGASTAAAWASTDAVMLVVMWAVMMVAMMLPSAAPMILLFSRIGAMRTPRGTLTTPVGYFIAGYISVWTVFSVIAGVTQWSLHSLAVLSPEMRSASPVLSAGILIAAGVYQWLPVKQSCLAQCRSPLGFLSTSWREGRRGAMMMGVTHGTFCVGCCWMLMALLFVAGVMNLAWVAALSTVVLLEKTVPAGPIVARVIGVAFIAAAAVILG